MAVNCFFGEQRHSVEKVRDALDLDPSVPIVLCDARDRESSKQVLLTLIQYVRSTRRLPIAG